MDINNSIIRTSDFFMNGYNGIFKLNITDDFNHYFLSAIGDKFSKLVKKPKGIIIDRRLGDYEIISNYDDAISLPIELIKKFHYEMILDTNLIKNKRSYFGFFKDKYGILRYSYVYFHSFFKEWNCSCNKISSGKWHVGDCFLK